tara:strand:+ start:2870 stop:3043 length:174 start_codon:yes stop_codon:yes gene_type:complete
MTDLLLSRIENEEWTLETWAIDEQWPVSLNALLLGKDYRLGLSPQRSNKPKNLEEEE